MRFRRDAVFPGVVLGAALGATALLGGVAHADPSNAPVTIDDYNNLPYGLFPDGAVATLTPISATSPVYLWQVFDNADHDHSLGEFTNTYSVDAGSFGFYYNNYSNVVSDSSVAGVPDGTTWGADLFGLPLGPMGGIPLFQAYSVSVPDDMSSDFWALFGVGYESVTSDAGTTDFLYLFGDFIPLFDVPA